MLGVSALFSPVPASAANRFTLEARALGARADGVLCHPVEPCVAPRFPANGRGADGSSGPYLRLHLRDRASPNPAGERLRLVADKPDSTGIAPALG